MRPSICFLLLLSIGSGVHAAAPDIAGTYLGNEKLVVSACIDKVSTSPWRASFSVDGDAYTGDGSSTSGGTFTFQGKLVDDAATGTVEGRTPEGRLWEGRTQATVSPQGTLVMRIDGKVPTAGCHIVVTINATKAGG